MENGLLECCTFRLERPGEVFHNYSCIKKMRDHFFSVWGSTKVYCQIMCLDITPIEIKAKLLSIHCSHQGRTIPNTDTCRTAHLSSQRLGKSLKTWLSKSLLCPEISFKLFSIGGPNNTRFCATWQGFHECLACVQPGRYWLHCCTPTCFGSGSNSETQFYSVTMSLQ